MQSVVEHWIAPKKSFAQNFTVLQGDLTRTRGVGVEVVLNEDGNELMYPGGRLRFLEARYGDHLMIPFQCELCHFRNIYGKEPAPNNFKDKEFFMFCRRANLDAFWSREPPTVRNNLKEVIRMRRTEERFGFPCTTLPLDPFPIRDDLGNKMWISTSISHQFWFTRFMGGIHKRVGEVKRQDEAFTIDIIHQIKQLLEQEWGRIEIHDTGKRKRIVEIGVWYIVGCTGMRDEELLLIELAGTRNSLEHLVGDEGCFKVVVNRRTKGN